MPGRRFRLRPLRGDVRVVVVLAVERQAFGGGQRWVERMGDGVSVGDPADVRVHVPAAIVVRDDKLTPGQRVSMTPAREGEDVHRRVAAILRGPRYENVI